MNEGFQISRGVNVKPVPAQLLQALISVALATEQGAALMAGFRIALGLYEGRYNVEVTQAGKLVPVEGAPPSA